MRITLRRTFSGVVVLSVAMVLVALFRPRAYRAVCRVEVSGGESVQDGVTGRVGVVCGWPDDRGLVVRVADRIAAAGCAGGMDVDEIVRTLSVSRISVSGDSPLTVTIESVSTSPERACMIAGQFAEEVVRMVNGETLELLGKVEDWFLLQVYHKSCRGEDVLELEDGWPRILWDVERQALRARIASVTIHEPFAWTTGGLTKAVKYEGGRLFEPPCDYPSTGDRASLARFFIDLSEAYTNGLSDVTERLMLHAPSRVATVADSVLADLARPLFRPFLLGFLLGFRSDDFKSVEEFERIVGRDIEKARFLGELGVRRGAYTRLLPFIERHVLIRLNAYRREFAREGRSDLEASAAELVENWCRRIESEAGFTRSYVLATVRNRSGVPSVEWARRFARHETAGLVRAGYSPKWIETISADGRGEDAATAFAIH